MKKWKCIICGYIHEGETPPESCPICKAPASKFILLEEGDADDSQDKGGKSRVKPDKTTPSTDSSDKEKTKAPDMKELILDQMVKHHLHPVSVHIPNGILPVAVLFFVAALIFNMDSLAKAGFYNIVVVLVALPLVIFAGFVEWVKKYNAAMTNFFKIKITAALITFLACLVSLVWFIKEPAVLHSSDAWIFILINVVMVGSAGVAGFLGGKLVFKD